MDELHYSTSTLTIPSRRYRQDLKELRGSRLLHKIFWGGTKALLYQLSYAGESESAVTIPYHAS